jgi:hypothetical protein
LVGVDPDEVRSRLLQSGEHLVRQTGA